MLYIDHDIFTVIPSLQQTEEGGPVQTAFW